MPACYSSTCTRKSFNRSRLVDSTRLQTRNVVAGIVTLRRFPWSSQLSGTKPDDRRWAAGFGITIYTGMHATES